MDSLANYCSDGENSNNSGDAQISNEKKCCTRERKASDVNYDPVQMDMSEESNNNNSSDDSESDDRTRSPATLNHQTSSAVKSDSTRSRRSPSDQRHADHDSYKSNWQGDIKRSNKNYRVRSSEERCHRSSNDRKHRDSDYKDSKKSRDDDRRHYDEDRRRDKNSSNRYSSGREDRHDEQNRRSKYRDRDQRHSSRSDRTKDRYRDERSSYQKDKDRARSRSRSKDRSSLPSRSLNYREEKGRSKLAQLEKLGIELKTPECTASNTTAHNEQSFYNPLTTATQGKYAEQIQKRKLLWANKSKQEEGKSTPAVSSNTWMGTTFTHDQDGKLSAKFKRLMGIKNEVLIAPTPGQKPEILKKQEEMFNNMEQQYEVARATTHTQRGVGLGYASSGYQFPR